ncbi:hypothetical protein QTO34_004962 [Cnephaeus nilssonii]|uniref:NMDA receptor synaptonuclear signaling and neuronal migration factor n=1 Tax=Cnephaeus nilssonii TaxID=3371016 RepID=A0AA40HMJ3_CNENI|nr:hypothetical protein QTO34_004962 [Eptesicus nilssonii]
MGAAASRRRALRSEAMSSVAAKVRAARAFGEYLSQSHPENRNGADHLLADAYSGHEGSPEMQPAPQNKRRLSLVSNGRYEGSLSEEVVIGEPAGEGPQPRVYTISGEPALLPGPEAEAIELAVVKGRRPREQHPRHHSQSLRGSRENVRTACQSWAGGRQGSQDCPECAQPAPGPPLGPLGWTSPPGPRPPAAARSWRGCTVSTACLAPPRSPAGPLPLVTTPLSLPDDAHTPIRTWFPKENLFSFQTATTTMQAVLRGYAERKRRKRESDSASVIQRNFRKHLRMVGSRRVKAQTFAERRERSFSRSWSDPTPMKADTSHDSRDSRQLLLVTGLHPSPTCPLEGLEDLQGVACQLCPPPLAGTLAGGGRSPGDPCPTGGDLQSSHCTLGEAFEDLDWEAEKGLEAVACDAEGFLPPKVMLISSKVPRAEYIPTIIRRDDPSIIPILYDHEHATFEDILEEIEKKLNIYHKGAKIWKMLIFCQVGPASRGCVLGGAAGDTSCVQPSRLTSLSQGGPGHLYLLKNKVATFAKVEKEEDMIYFWKRLSRLMSKVNPEPNIIHIMGCYILGNPNGEKLFQNLRTLMTPYRVIFESPLELSAQAPPGSTDPPQPAPPSSTLSPAPQPWPRPQLHPGSTDPAPALPPSRPRPPSARPSAWPRPQRPLTRPRLHPEPRPSALAPPSAPPRLHPEPCPSALAPPSAPPRLHPEPRPSALAPPQLCLSPAHLLPGKQMIETYFDFRLYRLWKSRQHSKLLDFEDVL